MPFQSLQLRSEYRLGLVQGLALVQHGSEKQVPAPAEAERLGDDASGFVRHDQRLVETTMGFGGKDVGQGGECDVGRLAGCGDGVGEGHPVGTAALNPGNGCLTEPRQGLWRGDAAAG
ncbi:hypothetical protein D9M68_780550 [compost metagenome]